MPYLLAGLLLANLAVLLYVTRNLSSYSGNYKDALRLLSERARVSEDANSSLRSSLSSLAEQLASLRQYGERETYLREQLSFAQSRVVYLEGAVTALGDLRAQAAIHRQTSAPDMDTAPSGPSRWQLASGRYEPPTPTYPEPEAS